MWVYLGQINSQKSPLGIWTEYGCTYSDVVFHGESESVVHFVKKWYLGEKLFQFFTPITTIIVQNVRTRAGLMEKKLYQDIIFRANRQQILIPREKLRRGRYNHIRSKSLKVIFDYLFDLSIFSFC